MPATCPSPNAPNAPGPTPFEKALLCDPKVIDKLEQKEARRRRGLAGMRHQWATGNLDAMTMSKKLAASNGTPGFLCWMDIYGDIELRDRPTLKKVAQLRKQLVYERFPLEPWE